MTPSKMCKHFTGTAFARECRAGVKYEDVIPKGHKGRYLLPCVVQNCSFEGIGPPIPCDKWEPDTKGKTQG